MALVAEVTSITCNADSGGSLGCKYLTISGMGTDFEQNDYHVWIDVANGSSAPSGLSSTAVEANISSGASNSTVATEIGSVIGALDDFSTSVASNVVTVTNAVRGSVTDASDVDTGFTITTSTAGTGTKNSNHKHPEDDIMWFMQGDNLAI